MVASDDFKSLVPGVTSTDDIGSEVGPALIYQYMFERKTSPWEAASWDEEDLHKFSVDEWDIDRLYSLKCYEEGEYSEGDYYFVARVKHGEKHVFVELSASCDSSGFECHGGGEIYVTADVNVFYNVIACGLSNQEAVHASLLEDGYDVVPQYQVTPCPVTSWHNPSKLMFLCHEAIRDNSHLLGHFPAVLPPSLSKSIREFISVHEAVEDSLY